MSDSTQDLIGGSLSGPSRKLTAFVSFPSPYTQTLVLQALVGTLPDLAISLLPPDPDDPPALQWADYDLLEFEKPHSEPGKYLTSSYVYRKSLIRKHQLHGTIVEYLAKCRHRQCATVLEESWPPGYRIELQFAEDLDEMWIDELYDLTEDLRRNEDRDEDQKKWYILKPGFADRAQGVRLFSSKEELEAIFAEFEEEDAYDEEANTGNDWERLRIASEKADEAIRKLKADRPAREAEFEAKLEKLERQMEEDSEDEEVEDGPADLITETNRLRLTDEPLQRSIDQITGDMDANDSSSEEVNEDTGVMTSQLRHFLIQEYITNPVLIDIHQRSGEPATAKEGYKFHLRAYVLLTGDYTVHLSRTILALFSGTPYSSPRSGDVDLSAHLTNTCLQKDAFGAPTPPPELVKLFWDLEGLTAMRRASPDAYEGMGMVDRSWLENTFQTTGQVIAESVKAAVECGSFGLQLIPNAFEIFGVDLLLSFPTSISASTSKALPPPKISLLEYNAGPDFQQSGDALRPHLLEMFKEVVKISIASFFDLRTIEREEEDSQGQGTHQRKSSPSDWVLIGRGASKSYASGNTTQTKAPGPTADQ